MVCNGWHLHAVLFFFDVIEHQGKKWIGHWSRSQNEKAKILLEVRIYGTSSSIKACLFFPLCNSLYILSEYKIFFKMLGTANVFQSLQNILRKCADGWKIRTYFWAGPNLNHFTIQSQLLTSPIVKPFENIMGKGENAGDQHFLLFPTIFSTLHKTNFKISVTFILSSHAFNLDRCEILSFGKEISVTDMMISVFDREENIVGKGENAAYQHFLFCQICFQKLSFLRVVKTLYHLRRFLDK